MTRPDPAKDLIRVAMIQDGARLHYALPVALHRAGMLDRMFTDCFVRPGRVEARIVQLLRLVHPKLARAMAGRSCAELNDAEVTTNLMSALGGRMSRRRSGGEAAYYRRKADRTAGRVLRHGLGNANALIGYVRNVHPRLLAEARRTGLDVVADQIIAPAAVELEEARRQYKHWPQFGSPKNKADLDAYADWEQQTWAMLDHVTCASEYVKAGLVEQGVNPSRVSVIPYPIDTDAVAAVDRTGRSGPVTVGFVGSVSLRKGAPCFFEVAKRFDPRRVRFVMVGPIALDRHVVAAHRGGVELVGEVARSDVPLRLAQFDIFFFPSTCEGSAGAVMEALATGLPVVTSSNSGSVVRNGVEGFVRPCNDVDGYATGIEQLVDDADLRQRMAEAARLRAEQFDLDWYSNELASLFRRLAVEEGCARPVPEHRVPESVPVLS